MIAECWNDFDEEQRHSFMEIHQTINWSCFCVIMMETDEHQMTSQDYTNIEKPVFYLHFYLHTLFQ